MGERNAADEGAPPGEGAEHPEAEAPGHEAGVLDRALSLVEYLRRECPWDRAQTARSLVPHLLEESHEVAEAVLHGSDEELEGELGDLLLNVAFQIVVAEEAGRFDREGVVARLERKMRRRHPHLFGGTEEDAEAWETIKAREREARAGEEGVLEGIARGLDPLLRAHRIQDRASGVGFDWEDARGALEKVGEELREVGDAIAGGDPGEVEEELGDLLFAVVNLSRLAGLHASVALEGANAKFRKRFERLESLARERSIVLGEASLEDLDELWDVAKGEEQARKEEPDGLERQ